MTVRASRTWWASCPSPVAWFALLGAVISTYLTLYQLRITGTVWDPLFGAASSEAVLNLGRTLPIPDAAAGIVAYVLEAILALIDREPAWALLAFAALLLGLAVTGVMLLLTQFLVVHAACTLCIGSALISFINLALGRADLAASAYVVGRLGGPRK